jgi:hypothetical protein
MRFRVRRLIHLGVDVRSQNVRDPPLAHRTARIEPCRLTERAQRLGVVECVSEVEPLIEEALRLCARRPDPSAMRSESRHDPDVRAVRRDACRVRVMCFLCPCGWCERAEREHESQVRLGWCSHESLLKW